jgi:cytochrome c oxidase cbb3-type subunit I
MWDYIKLAVLALAVVVAAVAAGLARDLPYMVHALAMMTAAAITFIWQIRRVGEVVPAANPNEYMDGPVRFGVIATAFWGVVGFLVGVVVARNWRFPI